MKEIGGTDNCLGNRVAHPVGVCVRAVKCLGNHLIIANMVSKWYPIWYPMVHGE